MEKQAMGSRSRKAMKNILALGFSELITFAVSLILPRVILTHYGSAYNGLTLSISQFLRYISVLTLGVAGPTRVALYAALSKQDSGKVSGIIKATEGFYRKVALAFLLYVGALCVILPFVKRNEFQWTETLLLTVIIAIGVFFEYCFGLTYKTLLDADQKMYVYIIVQTIIKILNTAISIALIMNGSTIFEAKLFASICMAASPLIINTYAKKQYRISTKVEPDYSGLDQRKYAAASSIANIVHSNTDSFLLTLFHNASLLSVYSVYMLIMGGLQAIMRVFTTGLEAAFGSMWAKGEINQIRKYLNLYEFATFSFTIIAFSCTSILILPFVSLYTRGVQDIEYLRHGFSVLLIITTAMFCIRQPYLTLVQAAGKYKDTRNGAILEAVVNFSVSLVLIQRFDLIGITIGTLLANCIRTVQYAYYISKHLIDRNIVVVFLRFIWAIMTAGIIICIGRVLGIANSIVTWQQWIVSGFEIMAISVVVVTITSCLFYRNDLISIAWYVKNALFHKRKLAQR